MHGMTISFYLSVLLLLLSGCGEQAQTTPPIPTTPPIQSDVKSSDPATATTPVENPATSPDDDQSPQTMTLPASPSTITTTSPAPIPTTQTSTVVQSAKMKDPAYGLAQKSGCLACHAIDRKIVGPAWKDVAKRYVQDSQAKTKLIEKVSKGGRGNWTEIVGNMAMPPYSPRVSTENIEILVAFVLSLGDE